MDPRLDGKYDQQEMQRVIMAANLCIQSSPICRPQMSQVTILSLHFYIGDQLLSRCHIVL